jgi:hypothetical protein
MLGHECAQLATVAATHSGIFLGQPTILCTTQGQLHISGPDCHTWHISALPTTCRCPPARPPAPQQKLAQMCCNDNVPVFAGAT